MVAGEIKKVVENKFDIIAQLTDANAKVADIIKSLENRHDDEALQLSLKFLSEIRKQVAAALTIQKTLWGVEDVKETLDVIIACCKQYLPPEGIKALTEELQKRRSLMLEMKS